MSVGVRALVAFAVGVLGTWAAAAVARRVGLVDHPGPRKPHPSAVPLGGGVGVAAGVTAGLAGAPDPSGLLLLPSMWALVVVGLVDDARGLRARTRLILQAVVTLPILPACAPSLGLPRGLELALALLFALGVINAMKCIDCADGVAGAIAVAGAAALGSLGGWDGHAAVGAAVLAGACGGFLVLNRPPARCFLGEGGSTGLGLLLATVALATVRGAPTAGRPAVAAAVATVLAVPVLDFALVHARRVRNGIRSLADLMASADTDHLPHRLEAAGLGPRAVAGSCVAAVGMSGIAARLGLEGGVGASLLGLIAIAVCFLAAEFGPIARRSTQGGVKPVQRAPDTATIRGAQDGALHPACRTPALGAVSKARTGRVSNPRILVTGGAGFLGSHFVRHWLGTRGGELLNVDLLTYAGSPSRAEDAADDRRYHFLQADVTDWEAMSGACREFRPHLVVHFAAESHVTRSEREADRFWSTNCDGTRTTLLAAAAAGVSRFVHVSTDEVYGPSLQGVFREEDKRPGHAQATSVYAKSKAIADDIARRFSGDIEVVVVRPTNCFGPWQHPEKAFARWVTRALAGRRIPVWGDGLHVRQWLYADDLAEAIGLILDARSPEPVYNVGPRHRPEITNLDLATWLLCYLGLPEERLVLTPYDRPRHDRRYAVNPSRIEALGWRPGDAWRQFAETAEWYRRTSAWWTPLFAEAESIYVDAKAP